VQQYPKVKLALVADSNVLTAGPVRDSFVGKLRRDVAISLGLAVSEIRIDHLYEQTDDAIGRRLQITNTDIAFEFTILTPSAEGVLKDLETQLLDPTSALMTSESTSMLIANQSVEAIPVFECPAGTIMSGGQCTRCADGKHAPESGSTVCLDCPENQVPTTLRNKCVCQDGFYASSALRLECYGKNEDYFESSLGTTACTSCENLDCIECIGGEAILLSGFALSESNKQMHPPSLSEMTGYVAIFACPIAGGCPPTAENATTISRCGIGYTGALCAVCNEGYVKTGTSCLDCGGASVSVSSLVAYAAVGALLLGGALVCACRESDLPSASDQLRREGQPDASDVLVGDTVVDQKSMMTQAKILIGLMQIITELPEIFQLIYPPLFAAILDVLRVLLDPVAKLIELFRIECIGPLGLYQRFFIIMALPVVSICLIQLLRIFADRRARSVNEPGDILANSIAKNSSKADYRMFFAVFLMYPLLSKTVFHVRIILMLHYLILWKMLYSLLAIWTF
jgi:hypothetical protein